MLPFEILPFEPPVHAPALSVGRGQERTLPLHVEPQIEESLFSWLQRLATRLQVSFHALASQTFGVDDRTGRTVWWHRPHPWTLARISQRTGVKIARLRSMTFEELQPVYRDDEDAARFAGRRYDTRAPDWRAYRFAVCGPCLEGDPARYLRSIWHLGWLAACPIHDTILISRCEQCHCGVRVPQLTSGARFSPTTCTRCGETLLKGRYQLAHPSVLQLQETLLKGKRTGVTEIAGLGTFSWPEMVALADAILGALWTHTTLEECQDVLFQYRYEPKVPRPELRQYECRHDSLRFLAWLIDDWPNSLGASIGRDLLRRALTSPRSRLSHHVLPRWKGHPWSPSPHDFAPEILARLHKLL